MESIRSSSSSSDGMPRLTILWCRLTEVPGGFRVTMQNLKHFGPFLDPSASDSIQKINFFRKESANSSRRKWSELLQLAVPSGGGGCGRSTPSEEMQCLELGLVDNAPRTLSHSRKKGKQNSYYPLDETSEIRVLTARPSQGCLAADALTLQKC